MNNALGQHEIDGFINLVKSIWLTCSNVKQFTISQYMYIYIYITMF